MRGAGLLAWYLAAINLLTFAVFGRDKRLAVRHRFRVSERTLFTLAALGGALGGLLAVYFFRHKTKRRRFTVGLPLILAVQMGLFWLLLK